MSGCLLFPRRMQNSVRENFPSSKIQFTGFFLKTVLPEIFLRDFQKNISCEGDDRPVPDSKKKIPPCTNREPPLDRYPKTVRHVNVLFRVLRRMSVVAASQRCERLTQAVPGNAFRREIVIKITRSLAKKVRVISVIRVSRLRSV